MFNPPIYQPPTTDDDNISLLIDSESSVLKLNILLYLIIWRGDWIISLVKHFVFAPKNYAAPKPPALPIVSYMVGPSHIKQALKESS